MNTTSDFLRNLALSLDAQRERDLLSNNIRHINYKLAKGKAGMKLIAEDGGFVILRKSYERTGVLVAGEATAMERLLTVERYFSAPEWKQYEFCILTKV